MSEERRNEMESRLRQNRARRIVDGWSLDLGNACGIAVARSAFLSPEDSSVLKTCFIEKLTDPGTEKTWWRQQEKPLLLKHLHYLSDAVGAMPIILFSSVDSLLGAVRLPADLILRNVVAVWSVVQEDLCIATEDLADGLCLEQNFHTPDGDFHKGGVFELSVWGRFNRGLA
jgi:hypothetical protein